MASMRNSTTHNSPNRRLLKRKTDENACQRPSKRSWDSKKNKQNSDFLNLDGFDKEENLDLECEGVKLYNSLLSKIPSDTLKDKFSQAQPESGKYTAELDESQVGSHSAEEAALESFECPLCGLGLSSGDNLEQHVVIHAGEREAFECGVCSKVFYEATAFGKHLRQHTGDRPFRCQTCGKSFREKCSLTRHKRTHTGEKPFTCEVCDKSFADVGSYGRHKKTHMGNRAKVHQCPYADCSKSFIDKSSLKRHVKTHSGERPYQCQVCKKSFTESGSFKRHQRVHTGEKRFRCRGCGRAFTEKASMMRHQRNVCNIAADDLDPDAEGLDEDDSPYSLEEFFKSAAKTRKNVRILNNNNSIINNNNSTNGSLADDASNDVAMYSSSSNIGMPKLTPVIHKNDPEVSEAVNDSDSTITNSDDSSSKEKEKAKALPSPPMPLLEREDGFVLVASSLTMTGETKAPCVEHEHLEAKVRTECVKTRDSYMCFECGDAISDEEDFYTSSSEKHHDGSLHPEEKSRRCRICRKEAAGYASEESPPSLSEESRSQSVSLRNRCPHCGKSFQDSSKLKRHVKIHTGIRDFKCSTCGKAFIEACSLRRHESVHSDVKPHTCPCGKGFTDSSGLKKHSLKCSGKVRNEDKIRVFDKFTGQKKEKEQVALSSAQEKPIVRDSSFSPPLVLNSIYTKNRDTIKSQLFMKIPDIYLRSYHSNMLYICTECGQSCEDAPSLRLHFLSHLQQVGVTGLPMMGTSGSPVSCPTCGKMFISSQYLHQHMKNHGTVTPTTAPFSTPADTAKTASSSPPNPQRPDDLASAVTSSADPKEANQAAARDILSGESASPSLESVSLGPTSCEVCGKTFADRSSLKRHARLHLEQHPQTCEGCSKVFWDQGSLKRHQQRGCAGSDTHTQSQIEPDAREDGSFLCTQCKKVFPTKEALMTHEKAHRVLPALRCTLCRKSFPDAASLKCHSRLHTNSCPYACDVCHKAFADSGSLAKHRARGCYPVSPAALDSDKLPCADCGKVFSNQSSFDQHVSSHQGVKPFSCSHCGKSFTEACSLKRHTRLHTGQNLCRCLHCGRTFLENSGLKKHLERRSCQQEKRVAKTWLFPCSVCPKVFTKRYILMRHMKTHLGLRPFACDRCGKSFTESSSLKRHYRQHTGERPYLCGSCGKAFTDAGVLKKHRQRCPFITDLNNGDSSSVTSSLLDSSQVMVDSPSNASSDAPSSHHVSESPAALPGDRKGRKRPKQCRLTLRSLSPHFPRGCWRCGKRFVQLDEWERHKRLAHSGAWPFKCLKCWRCFTRLPYLRVHKSYHHPDPSLPLLKVTASGV